MESDQELSTVRLMQEALDEARELTRLEVALARQEVMAELRQVQSSAIAFGGSAAAVLAAFIMCMVAIALAFSAPWAAALVIAAVLLCIGGALGVAAFRSLPAKPLAKTKQRIEEDMKLLKERSA